MGFAATRTAPEGQGLRRWRWWADAAAAVGAVMAVLLLARAALAFTFPAVVRLAGGDVGFPHHLLVWLRLALPAAIVLTGLLGWWLVAAAVAWSAVAMEAVLDPSPVPITLAGLVALALSVPGGFRRGRHVLGPRRLSLVAGAAALVGLGAPALTVALGDVSGGFVAFAIDSRTHAGIKVGQYAVVALALVLAVGTLAPHLRWRALSITAAVAAFVGTLVLTDHTPYEAWVLPRLQPAAALAVGGAVALALAAILVPLVERGANQ